MKRLVIVRGLPGRKETCVLFDEQELELLDEALAHYENLLVGDNPHVTTRDLKDHRLTGLLRDSLRTLRKDLKNEHVPPGRLA